MPTKALVTLAPPGTNGAHAAPASTALPFDPSLPWACALPWGGAWGETRVVFDLYRAQEFVDERADYMAASIAAGRALDTRLATIAAMPDGPDKQDALEARGRDYRVWRKADCLRQIAFFVLRVEWPDGTLGNAGDPATWTGFPLRFLEWIVDDGYTAAYQELFPDPKATAST